MKNRLAQVILILLCPQFIWAQISTIDRITSYDSVFKRIDFSTQIAISLDKQQTNTFYLNTSLELDHNFKNHTLLYGLFNNTLMIFGQSGILNKGSSQIGFRDKNYRRLYPDIYCKLMWNAMWGLEYRNINGVDLVFRWNKNRDAKRIKFFTGLGLFYDMEKWNWQGVPLALIPPNPEDQYVSNFGLNNYWKIAASITQTIDINSVSYFLFPANDNFLSPQWIFEFNAYFKASSHVNIVCHWDNIRDMHPRVPIGNFFYSYTFGLQVKY